MFKSIPREVTGAIVTILVLYAIGFADQAIKGLRKVREARKLLKRKAP